MENLFRTHKLRFNKNLHIIPFISSSKIKFNYIGICLKVSYERWLCGANFIRYNNNSLLIKK